MHASRSLENTASTTRLPGSWAVARSLATWLVRAVALGAVALAAVPGTRAEIVYSGNINVTATDDSIGVYLDFDSSFTTSTTGTLPAWRFNISTAGSPFHFVQPNSSDTNGRTAQPVPLTAGTAVETATFVSSFNFANSITSTPAYVGVKFTGDDSFIHYGWVLVSWGSHPAIVSAAYNSVALGGITAGQTVPEPAHAALLLGAGAVGLLLWRKQRNSLRPAV